MTAVYSCQNLSGHSYDLYLYTYKIIKPVQVKYWFDWKLNFQEPLLLYSPTPTAAATAPATPTPTPTPLC